MVKPRGWIGGNPQVDVIPVGSSKMHIVMAGNMVGGISHQAAMRKFVDRPSADAYAKRLKKVI